MAKTDRPTYVCASCGAVTSKWFGKCSSCGEWGTIEERQAPTVEAGAPKKARVVVNDLPPTLDAISDSDDERILCGIGEFDRILGGGIVPGSIALIGGDPGIGKSTLLLQVCAKLTHIGARVLYVSGEESARQIKMRAKRLGIEGENLFILCETNVERIEAYCQAVAPDFMVVDSIQTVYSPGKASPPGSVSQVREAAQVFMHLAKQEGVTVFLVGHVTKEGALAGPRVLEHMVDAVLYFEGDRHQDYRILRAAKNRFGSVNEIGVFRMEQQGMIEVTNPSEFLLSGHIAGEAGSSVACSMEGSRPVLVDLQALVSPTAFGNPRRQASGFDYNRMILLIAVLEKRAGIVLYNQDVYTNVAGGLTLDEPAADLPLMMAIISSYHNKPLKEGWVAIGEMGLTGEVRAVSQMERRLNECVRMGFRDVIVPHGNARVKAPSGLTLHPAAGLYQAMGYLF